MALEVKMMRSLCGSLSLLASLAALAVAPLLLPTSSAAADEANFARYSLAAATEDTVPPVEAIEIVLGPAETVRGAAYRWWELAIQQKGAIILRARFLSDRVPMRDGGGVPADIERYLLDEDDYPAVEYIHAETGRALLPRFDFLEDFIPNPRPHHEAPGGFVPSGRYLGHALALRETGHRAWSPLDAKPLLMQADLLIGTGRTFKDDGSGRYPDYKADDYPLGEYRYVQWTEDDYRDLIDAGHNYFAFEKLDWSLFYDAPVFHRRYVSPGEYPRQFYRSSYMGPIMFIDEPAVRCGETMDQAQLTHLDEAPVFMTTYVGATINEKVDHIEKALHSGKVALGDMELKDKGIVSWDTELETAFYQMPTAIAGLVHEGRYALTPFDNYVAACLGQQIAFTPEENLRFHYAMLRGAARSFGKKWGTAIYGQMEQDLRTPSATLAYDMGASYLWFWTSDHDHHVPWVDQLEIARELRAHMAAHPRGSVEDAQRAARTAILLPYGYMLKFYAMWNQRAFRTDYANETGATHRDVLAAAVWEAVMALRNGEDFDFAIDMDGFDPSGYTRIVRVGRDASIENGTRVTLPSKIAVTSELLLGEPGLGSATKFAPLSAVQPRIDGAFDDWAGAHWIAGENVWDPSDMIPAAAPDPADLSVRAAFAVDATMFYLAAEVRDDVHVQQDTGWFIWRGDSLQVALDPLRDGSPLNYREDDLELGFALTRNGPVAWRFEGALAGSPGELAAAQVAIVRDEDAGVTRYEAAIPLAELRPLDFPMQKIVGANFCVNDADDPATGERDRFVQWAAGTGEKKAPDLFGVLLWEGEGADIPLRVQGKAVLRAGVVGDPWRAEFRAEAWDGRQAGIQADLLDETGKSVSVKDSIFLKGAQRFALEVPTETIRPGRYRLRLTLHDQKKEVLSETWRVHLVPPAD